MNAMLESLKELKDYEKQAIRAIGWDPTHQIQRPAKLYIPGQVVQPLFRGKNTGKPEQIPPSILSTSIQLLSFRMVDHTFEKAVYTYVLNGVNSSSPPLAFTITRGEGYVGKINQFVNINAEDTGEEKGELLLHLQTDLKKASDGTEWEMKAYLEFCN